MDINDLTLRQIKELRCIFGGHSNTADSLSKSCSTSFIGLSVIVRTYSAGVWFGTLESKSGSEVVLKNARRMWSWFAAKGISPSECAIHGIVESKSRICEPVPFVELDRIEILPCSNIAIESISGARHAKQ